MRKKLAVFFSVLFLLGFLSGPVIQPSYAVDCPEITGPLFPIVGGYEQITVSTAAVGLTIPAGAIMAVAMVEDQPLRYRDDGTDPTATVGTVVQANVSITICRGSLSRFRAIRDGGTDANLSVGYYR